MIDDRALGPKSGTAGMEVKPETTSKIYTFDDVQGVGFERIGDKFSFMNFIDIVG